MKFKKFTAIWMIYLVLILAVPLSFISSSAGPDFSGPDTDSLNPTKSPKESNREKSKNMGLTSKFEASGMSPEKAARLGEDLVSEGENEAERLNDAFEEGRSSYLGNEDFMNSPLVDELMGVLTNPNTDLKDFLGTKGPGTLDAFEDRVGHMARGATVFSIFLAFIPGVGTAVTLTNIAQDLQDGKGLTDAVYDNTLGKGLDIVEDVVNSVQENLNSLELTGGGGNENN